MRVAIVQGTRPEIVKNYALRRALSMAGVPFEVLHTGQHSIDSMCAQIYREMGYEPTQTMLGRYSIGAAIDWLQHEFHRRGVTHVVVNGDTAAALAGAVAAMYQDIPVSHIEAGLRARDVHMLEERNRIAVDAIASLLFAYTEHERKVLESTPDIRGKVLVEGNTTVDVLHDCRARIESCEVPASRYLFVTMHRKEFTDSVERMRTVFSTLAELARTLLVIFPMHPRTADAMRLHRIPRGILGGVRVLPPCGPIEALALQRSAAVVLTDSGCVQEEAYMLGVPCITIRDNTERHLTVRHGANVVTGFDRSRIIEAVNEACGRASESWPDIYGRPGAGDRIVRRILDFANAGAPRRSTCVTPATANDAISALVHEPAT
jgi:UDP-N-acetylglucosamine 2-epimerase